MDKTTILYVCRLFNGLETSVKLKKWSPTGVPTIYRMIDALNISPNHKVKLVLTQKTYDKNQAIPYLSKIKFDKFDLSTVVLSAINLAYLQKLGKVFQEMFHIIIITTLLLKNKYDCIYVDNANLYIAAIVSRLRIVPVVFRVMGVYPAMRDIADKTSLKNTFLKWCYCSPFSLVICTQDGSGVEPWLERSINPDTPVHILINGVESANVELDKRDSIYKKFSIPSDKFIVFFLGKLEKVKGIYEFINGFNIANEHLNEALQAIIIGHGDQYNNIKKAIKEKPNITLVSRVPHKEILEFHKISDIYISTNRLANLTNANLESMSLGGCIVIPKSQWNTYVDIVTDGLVSDKSVYRMKFPPSESSVAQAIIYLYNNPKIRELMSKNILEESKEFISTWDSRIMEELDIIKSMIGNSKN